MQQFLKKSITVYFKCIITICIHYACTQVRGACVEVRANFMEVSSFLSLWGSEVKLWWLKGAVYHLWSHCAVLQLIHIHIFPCSNHPDLS